MARIKKCKQCGNSFEQFNSLSVVCSPNCAIKFNNKKEVKKRIQQMKKDLRTHKDYVQILQKVFNEFIRLRDFGKPCICCNKPLGEVYHCGHFFSTGAYPNLRFDEDNAHGQIPQCNTHFHGNLSGYAINLPKRIGWERFEALHARSLIPSKLTIPELQEKIRYYKDKIKEIKNE